MRLTWGSGYEKYVPRSFPCTVPCARVARALHRRHHRRGETTKRIRKAEVEAIALVICEAIGLKAWLTPGPSLIDNVTAHNDPSFKKLKQGAQ